MINAKQFLMIAALILFFFGCVIAAVNATGYANLRSTAYMSCACEQIGFRTNSVEVQHCVCGNQECMIGATRNGPAANNLQIVCK
jgi:hypothetical protein